MQPIPKVSTKESSHDKSRDKSSDRHDKSVDKHDKSTDKRESKSSDKHDKSSDKHDKSRSKSSSDDKSSSRKSRRDSSRGDDEDDDHKRHNRKRKAKDASYEKFLEGGSSPKRARFQIALALSEFDKDKDSGSTKIAGHIVTVSKSKLKHKIEGSEKSSLDVRAIRPSETSERYTQHSILLADLNPHLNPGPTPVEFEEAWAERRLWACVATNCGGGGDATTASSSRIIGEENFSRRSGELNADKFTYNPSRPVADLMSQSCNVSSLSTTSQVRRISTWKDAQVGDALPTKLFSVHASNYVTSLNSLAPPATASGSYETSQGFYGSQHQHPAQPPTQQTRQDYNEHQPLTQQNHYQYHHQQQQHQHQHSGYNSAYPAPPNQSGNPVHPQA